MATITAPYPTYNLAPELEAGRIPFTTPSTTTANRTNRATTTRMKNNPKLRDCTYKAIPLCAAGLLIFTIGAGLAYAIDGHPLPKNATVGVSLTFLALAVLFALGCLKMYHDTHESHIPRLDPVREACRRISRCPGAMQQHISRLLGTGGFAEQAERDRANEDLNAFLKRQAEEVSSHPPFDHDGSKAGKGRDDRRQGVTRKRQQPDGNPPAAGTRQGRGDPRPKDGERGGRGGTGQHERRHEAGKSYDIPLHQTNNNALTHGAPYSDLPPIPGLEPSQFDDDQLQQDTVAQHPSNDSSIGHTPPRLLRNSAITNTAAAKSSNRKRRTVEQRSAPWQQQQRRRHDGSDNPVEQFHTEHAQATGIASFPPHQEAIEMTKNPLGIRHHTNIQANMFFVPQNLGQDVFRHLEATGTKSNNSYRDGKLMYGITKTLMPKTQNDLDGDGQNLILPRSSSRSKTVPVHKSQTQESSDTALTVETQRGHRESHNPYMNPDADVCGYGPPLPELVSMSTIPSAQSSCDDGIAPWDGIDQGAGFGTKSALTKHESGRWLTKPRRKLRIENGTACQDETEPDS